MKYDIIIVGAGISGATLAERCARVLNRKVLVIEKRNHIGGNCYDSYDKHGILVSQYGAHIFHTNFEDVWAYVNKFSSWYQYEHKVVASVDGRFVPVPVNITTVNRLFNLNFRTENEMTTWLASQTADARQITNSEESALARVGSILYEKMFKNYTQKQWNIHPSKLDKSILERIPVRTNFDDRYFTDNYQALPVNGYTELFRNILDHPNITVLLDTDYFEIKEQLKNYERLFFTGPIDRYFDYKYGQKLQYRSLRFEFETYDKEYYQSHAVINYPNEYEFTRIVEYKRITGQKHSKTTISKEFPTWKGEPYYPVVSKENQEIYKYYQKEAEKLEQQGIYFVGRLANYKYFNMDQAFKNALDTFYRIADVHQTSFTPRYKTI